MDSFNPLAKVKEQYQSTIDIISSKNSAVGIDAQYTHAIIIEYLKEIIARLEKLEKFLTK